MILALALFACAPDDVTDDVKDDTAEGDADTDTDTDVDTDSPGVITGSWISEGDDISVLFAAPPFNYASLVAEFAADGSYGATGTDTDGATYEFVGTYEANADTNPGTITLTQTAPYAATAAGIWQVEGTTLTYEVVQTQPDYGFTPATPEAGFGSTGGPGVAAGSNIQIYQAQ